MYKKKSFANNDFAFMLNHYQYNINTGDIVAGTIFHQENQGFIVDIGENIAGYLPIEETSIIMKTSKNHLKHFTNETREFFILNYNKRSKQITLSIKRLEYIRAWKRIKQLANEDITLEPNVEGFNKGGIIILIEGLQGFIPNSHLVQNINKSLIQHKKIQCKLLVANEKTNQLILSHKKAILSIDSYKFKIGDIIIGKVVNIKSYGIFININGIATLLHRSEIEHTNIKNLNEIFHVGDNIEAKILHIDLEQGRLYISRKYLDKY